MSEAMEPAIKPARNVKPVAQAVPAAPPVPGAPVKPVVAQTLRAAQARKFPPSSLKTVGFGAYDTLTITAPAEWAFEDVLKPVAWTNVCAIVAKDALNTRADMVGSLIEVRRADHAFFAVLYIQGITLDHLGQPNGLTLQCVGPSVDPATGKACPVDVKTGGPWVPPVKED